MCSCTSPAPQALAAGDSWAAAYYAMQPLAPFFFRRVHIAACASLALPSLLPPAASAAPCSSPISSASFSRSTPRPPPPLSLSRGRVLQSAGVYIELYGGAVVLACGASQHHTRLEHCKAYSRSEIVQIRICCIHFLLRISCCYFGSVCGISAHSLTYTRNFQHIRFRRFNRFRHMSTQLLPNLRLRQGGTCIAGSASLSAATKAVLCSPHTTASTNRLQR
jgi:hypothetical protein